MARRGNKIPRKWSSTTIPSTTGPWFSLAGWGLCSGWTPWWMFTCTDIRFGSGDAFSCRLQRILTRTDCSQRTGGSFLAALGTIQRVWSTLICWESTLYNATRQLRRMWKDTGTIAIAIVVYIGRKGEDEQSMWWNEVVLTKEEKLSSG